MHTFRYYLVFLVVLFLGKLNAQQYRYEIGPLAGNSYYVGDATPVVFQNNQLAYGAIFRYKFDSRWALAVKGIHTNVSYNYENVNYKTPVTSVDVSAEFNFFKLERSAYNYNAKVFSPYLGIGIGTALCGKNAILNAYLPISFGLKWAVVPRVTLFSEWQHQFFLTDKVEAKPELNNSYNMNGSNFLRNDLLSVLTIGVGFSLWEVNKTCRICD